MAGYGVFGVLSEPCAAVIADLRQRWFGANGNVLRQERKPEEVTPETPAEPEPAPKPAPRMSREELAQKIAAHVRASQRPVTYADLAAAFGVNRTSSSLVRAVALARDNGDVRMHEGRGLVAA